MRKVHFKTDPCIRCKKTSAFILDADKVKAWKGGELVQNVFPELSKMERETLISGTHAECWRKMFG